MLLTRVILKNWRNFRDVDAKLRETTYVLGPNAAGKSNFLDVFRFLRDVCKIDGGGLQKAIKDRGGISKLRCLHARQDPEVRIEVYLQDNMDNVTTRWRYALGFKPEGKGAQRTLISHERVWRNDEILFDRPNRLDEHDPTRLTQTKLEQISTNAKFRDIANFFSRTTYLHLVPQLLKYGDRIGGHRLEDDPFGQGFLERVARSVERSRNARLRSINKVLKKAIPQFEELRFIKDDITGHPHLEARHVHHRPKAGWQREEHFSDGTLRLLGLLWSLLDGDSMLLLEEPELSLNEAIVRQIPSMLKRVQRDAKRLRQVLVSTHSDALLSNPGIDGRGVLVLEPSTEGTNARSLTNSEIDALKNGLSIAEVVLPKVRPKNVDEVGLFE